MQLSKRLSAVAEFVTPGGCLVDVGTDHGYVPIALLEQKKISSAIAMDVNTGALLAMAMYPTYDPANPPRDDLDRLNELMRLTVLSDVYEPGSTF